MNHVGRAPLLKRHLERRQHELGTQVIGHRPTDDASAKRIENHGTVDLALVGRMLGDVGDP
jgi:hypothetical protein